VAVACSPPTPPTVETPVAAPIATPVPEAVAIAPRPPETVTVVPEPVITDVSARRTITAVAVVHAADPAIV